MELLKLKKIFKPIIPLLCLVLIVISCCSCGKCKNEAHTFATKTVKETTCTSDGLVHKTCTKCGYEEDQTVPALEHNYKEVSTTATCTEAGKATYKCSKCGDTYEGDISALGHKWVEATCKEPKHCSVCGVTEGEKVGHNFVSGVCSFCRKAVIISIPSFPKKVSELKYDGQIESTVEITDISYEVTSHENGDNFVEFTICGKKVYDSEGSGISREMSFGYKVYDLNGTVKYSGIFRTTAVSVGESFSRSLPYVGMQLNYVPSGEYRLEIQDHKF